MSQRNLRVNELLKREISEILHTRYREEAVQITILDVDVTPDLRKAHVYFSVFGGEIEADLALRWLSRRQRDIRREVGRKIVLKYLPHLQFHYDPSIERGDRVLDILDQLDEIDPN